MSYSKDIATERGLTKPVWVTTAQDEMLGWISETANIDDIFEFIDQETSVLYQIKGWLAEVNSAEGEI